MEERRQQLSKIFDGVDESEKELIGNLLDEVVFLEKQMSDLKKLPFVKVHPNRPELQKSTAAARLYKECSSSYANLIRILLNILRKVDEDAQNELLKKLEEFAV